MDEQGIERGLFAVAKAIDGVAAALRRLGNADASTPMGAIEALGDVIERGLEKIADSISD